MLCGQGYTVMKMAKRSIFLGNVSCSFCGADTAKKKKILKAGKKKKKSD